MVIALLVLVCGGGAAIARFLADGAIESRRRDPFPWGTLVVNLGGTFVLGLLVGLSASHRTMELIGTATIGSYTTFSTWMLETHRPQRTARPGSRGSTSPPDSRSGSRRPLGGDRESAVSEPGIKLTTYFGEREREGGGFLADALFDVYERHRMRTSVLLRGVEGFGERHRLQTDRLLTLSESLPVVSVAIDTRERIEAAVPEVLELARHGLTTLERARLATGDGLAGLVLPDPPGGVALKLTVYGGRGVRTGREAGYVAAVDVLRAAGADGASVLLGVDGTLHGGRRRARFFARNAGVPLMLLSIGSRSSLQAALPMLSRLLEDPVITIERVQICKAAGRLLAQPDPVAGRDPSGLPIWQKLMVHVEEQAKHDGHPVHVQLGATAPRRQAPPARPCCAASAVSMATTSRSPTGCCRSGATCR